MEAFFMQAHLNHNQRVNSGSKIRISLFAKRVLIYWAIASGIISCSSPDTYSNLVASQTIEPIQETTVIATPKPSTLAIATPSQTEILKTPTEQATQHWNLAGRIVFQRIVDDRRIIFSSNLDGSEEYSYLDVHAVNATWPVLSPDGRYVAFVSTRDSTEESELGSRDIYTLEVSQRNSIKLTSAMAINDTPAWSPDGSKLAFTGAIRVSDPLDLYVMNRDGSEVVQFTSSSLYEFKPAWSFDGKKIAVLVSDGQTQNLNVIDAEKPENAISIETADVGNSYAWSHDSEFLALTVEENGGKHLEIAEAETGQVVLRLKNDFESSIEPTWSPDDKYIVFAAKDVDKYNIYVADSVTGEILHAINMPTDSSSPIWSTDGGFIFFKSGFFDNAVTGMRGSWNLFAVDTIDWHEPTLLVKNLLASQFSIWISP
jgi:Tol biopolymer transport system component